jgi:hypothetical protein
MEDVIVQRGQKNVVRVKDFATGNLLQHSRDLIKNAVKITDSSFLGQAHDFLPLPDSFVAAS